MILVLAIVGAGVGFGIGRAIPDTYRATTSVFVSATQGSTTTELQQGAVFTQAQVQSYAELATTPAVLSPVINDLGLDTTPTMLAKQITSTNPLNTVIVQITVSEPSGAQAARIANSVSKSLRTIVSDLAPQTQGSTPAIRMSIVTPAQTPAQPASPNRHLMEIIGLLAGLVIGVIYALARAAADTRIRSEQDVENLTDSPMIGRVQRAAQRDGITLLDAPTDAAAEDYRRIQATLQFAGLDGSVQSLTVVSPSSHEGRTSFAVNLALSSAERSQRVLLIDGDLRDSGIASITGVSTQRGLVDVLGGTSTLEESVVAWNGVDVLVAGTIPSNPNVVLGAPALHRVLETARDDYDFIVVDTPPLLPYADALAVVRETDGALVLASDHRTTRQQLLRTLTSLDGVKATTVGIVLVDSSAVVRAVKPTKRAPQTQPKQIESSGSIESQVGSKPPAPAAAAARTAPAPSGAASRPPAGQKKR